MTTKKSKPEAADDVEANEELVELLENLVKLTKSSRKRRSEPEPETEAETEAEAEAVEQEGAVEPEAVAEEEPEEEAEEEAEADGERRIRVLAIVSAALAMLLAAACTFGVILWFQYDRVNSSQDTKQKVAERAGVIARTMYNYDYHHTQDYLNAQAKVLSKTTAANAKKNWATMSTYINTAQLVQTTTVNQIYVGEINGSKATVIVDLNSKLVTSKGIVNQVNVLDRIKMVRERGQWMADGSPLVVGPGTETDTDLQGKPLATPSASPSPGPSTK